MNKRRKNSEKCKGVKQKNSNRNSRRRRQQRKEKNRRDFMSKENSWIIPGVSLYKIITIKRKCLEEYFYLLTCQFLFLLDIFQAYILLFKFSRENTRLVGGKMRL